MNETGSRMADNVPLNQTGYCHSPYHRGDRRLPAAAFGAHPRHPEQPAAVCTTCRDGQQRQAEANLRVAQTQARYRTRRRRIQRDARRRRSRGW